MDRTKLTEAYRQQEYWYRQLEICLPFRNARHDTFRHRDKIRKCLREIRLWKRAERNASAS
jgi:hypothetical protein